MFGGQQVERRSPNLGFPKKERRRSWQGERGWRAERAYNWLVLLPVTFLAIFFIWPLVQMVGRSFLEPAFGVSNYDRIVGTGPYLRVLWVTLKTSIVVTLGCLLIGYPVSVAIARSRRANMWMGLLMVPLWTSVVIRSYAWMIFFQTNGVVNEILRSSGLIAEPLRILQTPTAVYIAMIHILLPYMMLPLITNMRSMDRTLLQAAEVLGASPVRLFFRVYLPLSLPGVVAGVSLVFITALGFYITPALLGGTSTTMVSQLIEQQASTFLDWPLASALASMLLAITVSLYATFNWLTSAKGMSK